MQKAGTDVPAFCFALGCARMMARTEMNTSEIAGLAPSLPAIHRGSYPYPAHEPSGEMRLG